MINYALILAIKQFKVKQFISATTGLASLELEYGQLGQAQLLNQMMLTWKDPRRMRLGQIVGGCTPEYTVWRRQKNKDVVPLPYRMQVSVPVPVPMQPSEMEIIRSEFAFERSKMKQKYLRLQKTANKAENNARVQEHKAHRMVDVYTKAKGENENLYIANKKLWEQNRSTRIGRFFETQQRECESSQKESNHSKLRRKPITRKMSILSSLKSCPNAARVGDYGKRKLSPERYSARKCRKRRHLYKRSFKC